MPAPTPTLPTGQPVTGSTTTFEYALAYDNTGAAVPTPTYAQVPVLGSVELSFSPQTQMYDAYVASGDDAWSYAVKTGMQATLTVKSAAPLSDPVIAPLVQAGLAAGRKATILFRVKNPDGSYFYGTAVIGLQYGTPVRGVAEATFTGPTSGPVKFQAA